MRTRIAVAVLSSRRRPFVPKYAKTARGMRRVVMSTRRPLERRPEVRSDEALRLIVLRAPSVSEGVACALLVFAANTRVPPHTRLVMYAMRTAPPRAGVP